MMKPRISCSDVFHFFTVVLPANLLSIQYLCLAGIPVNRKYAKAVVLPSVLWKIPMTRAHFQKFWFNWFGMKSECWDFSELP